MDLIQQDPLWHDSAEDAFEDVLKGVYGKGWKHKAAAYLWPHEDPISKGKYLEHALDPDRSEKLSISEIFSIFKLGHEHGIHVGMYFLCDEIGYNRPTPVDLQDQENNRMDNIERGVSALLREFEALKRTKIRSAG